MKKLILIVILLTTGIVALEPFGIVMPTKAQMTAAGLLLGVLVFTLGVVSRERMGKKICYRLNTQDKLVNRLVKIIKN